MTHNFSGVVRAGALAVAGISVFALSGCGETAKSALNSSVGQSLKSAAASAMAGTSAGQCAEVAALAPQATQLATQLAAGQITPAQAQQELPGLEQKLTTAAGNGSGAVGTAINKLLTDAKALQQINPSDAAAVKQAGGTMKTDATAVAQACLPHASAS